MATSKSKKAAVLENVKTILESNKNVVLTEYRGMNVLAMTEFRATLRKAGVQLKVLKNTLSKRLFQDTGMEKLNSQMEGPIAVGFLSEDVAASTKVLLDFSKKNEFLKIKAGYIDGKMVSMDELKAIASLPSREVLLGMVLGTLQAPVKNLMTVMRGTTQNLVYALNALKEKKEKEAA
jgi:large subunit ribosomal protein L10